MTSASFKVFRAGFDVSSNWSLLLSALCCLCAIPAGFLSVTSTLGLLYLAVPSPACCQSAAFDIFEDAYLSDRGAYVAPPVLSHVKGACRYPATDYGYADLRDGKLDITLYPDTGLIEGTATLSARIRGGVYRFPFALHSRAEIRSVKGRGKNLKWCRDGNIVLVTLPDLVHANGTISISVKWLVKVGAPSSDGPLTPYLTEDGAYLPSSLLWHPRGIGSDGSWWQMVVKSPVRWKVMSTGKQAERYFGDNGLFHRFRIDEDVFGMALVAGDLRKVDFVRFSGGKLACLSPRAMSASSNISKYGNELRQILHFYKRHFGSPCFNNYAIVEMPSSDRGGPFRIAAEHSFMVVSEPPSSLKGPFLEFVATELARHWIGATGAVYDSLSESLAVYLGLLALRKFDSPRAYLASMMQKAQVFEDAATYTDEIRLSNGEVRLSGIKGLGTNVSPQLYDLLVRKKAPLLLACLEQAAGGVKPFVNILGKFMSYHRRNGCGGWKEFMGMYERISGIDLSNFALLYIDGPGLPENVARRIGYDVLERGKEAEQSEVGRPVGGAEQESVDR